MIPNGAPAVRPTVVVITGLSGAGKSQALHALEDLGFFCVDNLPTLLAPQAVALCERGGMTRVALGMDVRVREFLGELGNVLSLLESGGQRDLHLLFLDASDEALLRRFSETRRPHPLSSVEAASGGEGLPPNERSAMAVLDGVRLERERLAPLRARATRIVDTTSLSIHELRRVILGHFGPASGGAPRMLTRIMSFGFKYGTPVDADLVFDVRFLENPYFVPELKPQTGLDMPVAKYVLENPETVEFLRMTRELLAFMMPKYEREGKSYLTIAIGCTGGRHRSVAISEALAPALAQLIGTPVTVVHRDVNRKTSSAVASSAGSLRPGAAGPTSDHPPPSSATGPFAPHDTAVELRGVSNPAPPGTRGGQRGTP
jgi:UPF0042 nucleotide-binding protein